MTTRIDYEKELNPEQLAAVREGDVARFAAVVAVREGWIG